jgi:hypothetical protein
VFNSYRLFINYFGVSGNVCKIRCASIVGVGVLKKFDKRLWKEAFRIVYELIRTWAFLRK